MAAISRDIWLARENSLSTMTGAARSLRPGKLVKLRHGLTHYQLDEYSDRPLMICIHGWSTSSYVWDRLRPLLRDQGYRLLTYDLYGRGFSDRPDVPHTTELFTNQLTELLTRLGINKERLNVLGYSMGGAIAARFVSQRLETVDRMLLLAPAGMIVRLPILRSVARSFPRALDAHILAVLPSVLPRQFEKEAKGFSTISEVAQVLSHQKRELAYRGYVLSLLSSLKGVLASSMADEHRKIARSGVQVRALFATDDTTIPSPWAKRLFDQWYPAGVSSKIDGAGHGLTYTHPAEIIEEFTGSLRKSIQIKTSAANTNAS